MSGVRIIPNIARWDGFFQLKSNNGAVDISLIARFPNVIPRCRHSFRISVFSFFVSLTRLRGAIGPLSVPASVPIFFRNSAS